MDIKTSVESMKDFTYEVISAGKVAVASLIERIDIALCDAINGDNDE